LELKIPRFELNDQTLFDGLAALSSNVKSLAFGYEKVLRLKFSEPPTPEPRFSIELQNQTVREILDNLCKMDARSTWSLEGSTINVYPRATVGDSSYLLNRKLGKLVLRGITDIDQGLLAIHRQLPPPSEQVATMQVGGDTSYPAKPWTVTFTNLTVRQAMNRLAAHMGPRGSWILSGSQDFRAFSFQKLAFEGLSSR
jgi:hypothetical protein